MNDKIIHKYWEATKWPAKDKIESFLVSNFSKVPDMGIGISLQDMRDELFDVFSDGMNSVNMRPSKILERLPNELQRRYLFIYKNTYGFGKEALETYERTKFDATYEINDTYNIGIKNSNDPEKATIVFLDKENNLQGYSYYASTLADHKPGAGLYLDYGANVKLDGKSMDEVARIAKIYAGISDESEDYDDYDDEAALIKQTQADYAAGLLSDEEYEQRMDFLL